MSINFNTTVSISANIPRTKLSNFPATQYSIYQCFHSHSRKYGSLGSSPAVSKSTRHHIEEIQLTFDTATPTNHTSRGKYSSANNSPLLSGRGVLRQGSTHPPTLSYTRSLQCLLPSDCGISTLCLGPKTHPSRQNHLVIAQRTCSSDGAAARGGVTVGVVKLDQALMLEFDSILCSSTESVSLKERREWWGARGKLDKQLKVHCVLYLFLHCRYIYITCCMLLFCTIL